MYLNTSVLSSLVAEKLTHGKLLLHINNVLFHTMVKISLLIYIVIVVVMYGVVVLMDLGIKLALIVLMLVDFSLIGVILFPCILTTVYFIPIVVDVCILFVTMIVYGIIV